jgi:hypothetical protein
MTLEEARAVWLLRVGSDWISEASVEIEHDDTIWAAYIKLRLADSLDKDLAGYKVKIKCKS